MRNRTPILLAIGALTLIAVMAAGGYALGRAGAPDSRDAARDQARARQTALRNGREAVRQELSRIRMRGSAQGAGRGRDAGAAAGRQAALTEIERRGLGPTSLPSPKLPTDLTLPRLAGSTLIEQPSKIIVGNHEVLENVSWSSWGDDVAEGNATLVGVKCIPNCAQGPPTRDSVTLKASRPSFNPNNVRYYSRLSWDGSTVQANTLQIQPF